MVIYRVLGARTLGAVLFVASLFGAPSAGAVAQPCPDSTSRAGFKECIVEDGDTLLSVVATSLDGGDLFAQMSAGGQVQLVLQGFAIYSFDQVEFIDVLLNSATMDPQTRTIVIQFSEAFANALQITVTYRLSDEGELSTLDEDVSLRSTPPSPVAQISGRLYAMTDFDLGGDMSDETVNASLGGTLITQVDGGTTATQEVIGAAPTGFEVAQVPQLDPIFADVLLELNGTTSVPGPGNFQFALSWDRQIPTGQTFNVSLRKTVLIAARCGDGTLDAGEECDDNNNVSCDGCSEFCEDESLFPDSDGDEIVDGCDACKFFFNTLPLVISGFSGIPDECLCGDFDGDGFHSATDAAAVNDCAAFISIDCVSERDEVTGLCSDGVCINDGFYSATDADLINRVAAFIDPAYTLTCGRRPEGTCGGDTGVSCF